MQRQLADKISGATNRVVDLIHAHRAMTDRKPVVNEYPHVRVVLRRIQRSQQPADHAHPTTGAKKQISLLSVRDKGGHPNLHRRHRLTLSVQDHLNRQRTSRATRLRRTRQGALVGLPEKLPATIRKVSILVLRRRDAGEINRLPAQRRMSRRLRVHHSHLTPPATSHGPCTTAREKR
jgi:hypothetical protein